MLRQIIIYQLFIESRNPVIRVVDSVVALISYQIPILSLKTFRNIRDRKVSSGLFPCDPQLLTLRLKDT